MALGRDFAHHWMHHAFVVDPSGEKMSKSLGNFDNLLDLFDHHDPRAFRLVLLQAHYRSPVSLGADQMTAAERALGRLDAVERRAAGLTSADPDPAALDAFRARMDDDLDTPGATAVLFETATRANAALDAGEEAPAAARSRTGFYRYLDHGYMAALRWAMGRRLLVAFTALAVIGVAVRPGPDRAQPRPVDFKPFP